MLVEVCANSLESALNAEKGGADRIELCAELAVGGITPSYGTLTAAKKYISIPIHVLIRPRSGDFTYNEWDFESMLADIRLCREMGFSGIVSGVLHSDNSVDLERTSRLIEASKGMHFTFHRAFDWVNDPLASVCQLQELGVNTLLSSGQAKTAQQGIELLNQLQHRAPSMTIMPGSGINAGNVLEFKQLEFRAVHLSGTHFRTTVAHLPKVSMNTPSFLKDGEVLVSSEEMIYDVVNKVK